MVSISAGGIYFNLWASLFIGALGGVAYGVASWFLYKFKVDDPLEIF